MKVLIVTPYIAPVYGGPCKTVLELAQALSSFGVSVDIVTTNASASKNLDVALNIWIPQKSYRIKYFCRWNMSNYTISFSMSFWLFQHIIDYDLVHINTVFSYPVLATYWACQFHNIPYIRTPHGMLEPWALSYKAWKKRFYYTSFEKPALKHASAVHALASCEANNIKSLSLGSPIVVIPNGIYRQEFESLPDPEIFYQKFPGTRHKTLVLFLGRIDPKKGLDLLAPAFAAIHDQFHDTHLVVAGPDNTGFITTAQDYFAQAGCLDAVTFTGLLTGSLKHAALRAASLYVAPSYSEGFSMSVLEGMASGLPCVITTGCNFPEAAAAQVAHVVNIDAEAIADALIKCLSNLQQAKQMGKRAREFIFQNYTWEQVAKNLLQVYKAIIEKKPLPEYLGNVESNNLL